MIVQQVDCLNVEIGRVNLLPDSHLHLLAHQVGKCSGNRFSHWPFNPVRDFELACAGRRADFKAVQTNFRAALCAGRNPPCKAAILVPIRYRRQFKSIRMVSRLSECVRFALRIPFAKSVRRQLSLSP
jgi:hypothetical protein